MSGYLKLKMKIKVETIFDVFPYRQWETYLPLQIMYSGFYVAPYPDVASTEYFFIELVKKYVVKK